MIQLEHKIWKAFESTRDRFKPQRLDILTGFFGTGASKAISELGVNHTRFVFGLRSSKPALPKAQLEELRRLKKLRVKIRVCSGLHAKLYIFDKKVLLVGSVNFSKGGFEKLREVVIITDDPKALRDASKFFKFVWRKSKPLPTRIRTLRHESGRQEQGETRWQLGSVKASVNSPFSQKGQPSANQRLQTKNTSCKIRLVAFQPRWFLGRNWFVGKKRIDWSASSKTIPDDVHVFCVSSTLKDAEALKGDPRVQAVHSIWRACTKSHREKGWPGHFRAKFDQPLILETPVHMTELKKAKLLVARRSSRVGFPMNVSGKLLTSRKDIKKLAEVLSRYNRRQRARIYKALLLKD